MVLQRDKDVPVWGVSDPGAEIVVSFAGQKKSTRANASGKWKLALAPLVASAEDREFAVTATPPTKPADAAKPAAAVDDAPKTLTLKNVLVGEVWVCSGQSNMEQGIVFPNTRNGQAEASAAHFPLIRIKYSRKVLSAKPRNDWQGGKWAVCSPKTIRDGTWGGFSAAAYFFGRELHTQLKVPVGLLQVAWGGTRIEPWTPPEGFASVPSLKVRSRGLNPGTPSALYNAMVHPLVPFAIRGAIWYQGEANRGELDYANKTRALVQGWRKVWGQDAFPFYWVHLAPFRYNGANKIGDSELLAVTWEQQTAALAVPNTGTAITNDIGNLFDIHPGEKQAVGKRLARLALSRTYGNVKNFIDDSGPIFKCAKIASPRKIVVKFDFAKSGLKTRDGKAPSHFEVAGKDGIFHPAKAAIVGDTIEVTCEELTALKQVRFGWHELAVHNLTNGDALPAAAFRWKAE
jgi:sialate O-acetylesterase